MAGFRGKFHVRPGGLGHRYGIDQHSRSAWAKKVDKTAKSLSSTPTTTQTVRKSNSWSKTPWWKLDRIPTKPGEKPAMQVTQPKPAPAPAAAPAQTTQAPAREP